MTLQESIEKSHTIAREWFKEHRARLIASYDMEDVRLRGDLMTAIEWRRSDHSNYAMKYLLNGQYVIVTGDVGSAIYSFGQVITLEKLATFDWNYFAGKCVASEMGMTYNMKIPGVKHQVPHVRVIGHFIGLQMAIKQLLAVKE